MMDTNFNLMAEIDTYISTKTSNDIEAELDQYPHIRLIYKKYNCIRTTEAICERMFSFAGKCTIYREKNNFFSFSIDKILFFVFCFCLVSCVFLFFMVCRPLLFFLWLITFRSSMLNVRKRNWLVLDFIWCWIAIFLVLFDYHIIFNWLVRICRAEKRKISYFYNETIFQRVFQQFLYCFFFFLSFRYDPDW